MSKPTLPMGLLVSVRSVVEAAAALAGGVSIVDIKEPSRGPLGRAESAVTAAIVTVVAGHTPVTLACGELADGPVQVAEYFQEVCRRLAGRTPLPAAVKAGPGRLAADCWFEAFKTLQAALPPRVEAVAVAYADWGSARSVQPELILAAAKEAGAKTLLIDTFDKSGPGLFDVAGVNTIRSWIALARQAGLRLALAGRLSCVEVAAIFQLGGEIVGVRSAACIGGRHGLIDAELVANLTAVAQGREVTTP